MTDSAKHLGATLQDFLDGRLDAARQAEVRAHLEACPQCRAELETLRWVRDVALKQLPGEEVPPALTERVAAALDAVDRARPATSPLAGRRWRGWAAAGAIVVAALVLLLAWPPSPDLADAVANDFTVYSGGSLGLDLRSSNGEAVESLFV